MSQLPALLERVERATGPDRDLDADIVRTLASPDATVGTYIEGMGDDIVFHAQALGIPNKAECPAYTASIDAALALANRLLNSTPDSPEHPLEISISSVGHSKFGPWHCRIWSERHDDGNGDPNYGATPALAILSALLHSLIQDTQETRP